MSARRFPILGTFVDETSTASLNAAVHEAVARREFTVIANHNLHSLYVHRRSAGMREYCRRARLIHVDGMGVVALARLLGHPLSPAARINYSQWLDALLPECDARGYRLALLGGAPGVAATAAARLHNRYPRIRIEIETGYFDASPGSADNARITEWLHRFRPDILLVGMGMPRQEEWIVANAERLPPTVALNGGGILDLLAGELPEPPRWVGRIGMEWLYRLITRPRRVWFRYLVEPWVLLVAAARERWERRRLSADAE